MIVKLIFVLSAILTVINGQFDGCDYFKSAAVGETFYISSPGYSNFYGPNTNCRWVMQVPAASTFYMNCYDMVLPSSSRCSRDRLEVSLTGRSDLSDAVKYCGGSEFVVQSQGNKLVVALRTPSDSVGGRFRCQVTSYPPPCDCGRRKSTKIVGGDPTLVNEFPSMAGLVDLDAREVFCGATIISNQHAVTAAHCLKGKNIMMTALLVGEHDYSTGNDTPYSKLMLISTFTIHTGYTERPVRNDIALVRTRDEIIFNAGVGPACLPFRYSSATFVNIIVEAVGWGTLEFGGPVSSTLQKVELSVIDTASCARQLPSSGVTSAHMCTFTEGKDSCQYDSGGPLFYTNPITGVAYNVGVVSYGVTCASSKPSVSTRITSYLTWIQQNTPGINYCNL